jgi:hypothetical protein
MPSALLKLFWVIAALMTPDISPAPIASLPSASQAKDNPSLLEVRITSPPRWENGCLVVRIDRTNQSSGPIFLTTMGPYLDMALDVSTREPNTAKDYQWINLHGVSDFLSFDSIPLAAGATLHNDFCLGSLALAVNLKKETRREIPVRGLLRVRVSYFLSEDALKRYRAWWTGSPPYRSNNGSHEAPSDIAPKWATVVVEIPCTDATCESGCADPPRGISGEVRPSPDVFFLLPDWDRRGKLLTENLSQKFRRVLDKGP